MGFSSVFKGLKLLKTPGTGVYLNVLTDRINQGFLFSYWKKNPPFLCNIRTR